MRRSKTPSFVTELPLNSTPAQEAVLLKRLDAARRVYNACLGESLKRLAKMRANADYQVARAMPAGEPKSKKRRARNKAFREVRKRFDFGEYDLHSYAKQFGYSYLGDHLDSLTVQTVASRAFSAVNHYCLGIHGKPRFKSKNQFDSVEGKTNKAGIRWRDDQVKWLGLELDPIITQNDLLIQYGLSKPVKYVRIVRRKLNGRNRFYVQLVCEGKPYQKPKNRLGEGVVGLDIGPSTIAIVSQEIAELRQFCSELKSRAAEIKRLQRQIERQRRANNTNNYHPDKWVRSKGGKRWLHKKGKAKKGRHKWHISNGQRANESRLAELHRRQAQHRKSLHGRLVNRILRMGHIFKLEKISYKAWQKMFGRSVQFRAPGTFVSNLRRKAESAGGMVDEFPTRPTKLSQVCICGSLEKKPLSKRWHHCSCGVLMQRDLFSAFLAICVENDLLSAKKANSLWPGLEPVLWTALSSILSQSDSSKSANGKAIWPSSFGLFRASLESLARGRVDRLESSNGIPAKSQITELRFDLLETVG